MVVRRLHAGSPGRAIATLVRFVLAIGNEQIRTVITTSAFLSDAAASWHG